jgi:hypothetical protein
MNSAINNHPVANGSIKKSMGLDIKNPMMVSLYHLGAWPRKFFVNATPKVSLDITISL